MVLLEGTEGERWKKREQEHELKTTLGLNDGKSISRFFKTNPDNHFYFKMLVEEGYTRKWCGLRKCHYRLGHFQNTKSSGCFAKKKHVERKRSSSVSPSSFWKTLDLARNLFEWMFGIERDSSSFWHSKRNSAKQQSEDSKNTLTI